MRLGGGNSKKHGNGPGRDLAAERMGGDWRGGKGEGWGRLGGTGREQVGLETRTEPQTGGL